MRKQAKLKKQPRCYKYVVTLSIETPRAVTKKVIREAVINTDVAWLLESFLEEDNIKARVRSDLD